MSEKELLHADTMQDDLNYLKSGKDTKHNLRMVSNFQELLDIARRIVTTSYDEQQQAIEELEEFLL